MIFKEVAKLYADHYPEFMVTCFVIHPPMIMAAIWKCLQACRLCNERPRKCSLWQRTSRRTQMPTSRLLLANTWVPMQASAQPPVLSVGGSARWIAHECMQVFVDEGTKLKVLFVDKQGTQLLAAIDANVLPETMGGTRPATERLVTGADGERPMLLVCPGTLASLLCHTLINIERVPSCIVKSRPSADLFNVC